MEALAPDKLAALKMTEGATAPKVRGSFTSTGRAIDDAARRKPRVRLPPGSTRL